MKPHPPPHIIRKTVKWGGAAVTVLLVVVWIGSGWRCVWWQDGKLKAYVLNDGCVYALGPDYSFSHNRVRGWLSYHHSFQIDGRIRTGFAPGWDREGWQVPLWLLLCPTIAATSVAWRLEAAVRRRARLNLCPKCNYDRAGLRGGAGAVCPECGKLPA